MLRNRAAACTRCPDGNPKTRRLTISAIGQATGSSRDIEACLFRSHVADIERTISSFAMVPNGGLSFLRAHALRNQDLVVGLPHGIGLPAVYADRDFVTAGGLMSYSTELADLERCRQHSMSTDPQGREASRSACSGADQALTT